MDALNFISGAFLPSSGENWLDNIDPATGKRTGSVAASNPDDVNTAVLAARVAYPHWSGLSSVERAAFLDRIADGIDARLDELAALESRDTGKPLALARSVDIPRASANFRFFAGAVRHMASEFHETSASLFNFTLRRPLGVVGCISPWNLPLYLFSWKVAPALAAGNTVVGKPSELTPTTAMVLCEIARDAGLPDGVLNVVQGRGVSAGAAIVEHDDVSAVSFTGGTETGREIARRAAPGFRKLSLEMGGKNPTIVFEDANLDRDLPEMVRASFANQGEICLCGSRVLVHESIVEDFRDRFVERVAALKVGDPNESATDVGAVISEAHMNKVLGWIDTAKKDGGRILTGGARVHPGGRCDGGFFLSPAVIDSLPADCSVNQQEIFGPVATIIPFTDEREAVELANSTRYGLAASVWTNSLDRAHRVAAAVDAGVVWINCWMRRDLRTPFGGMKQSGVGREGGLEALRFFTEPKNVCIRVHEASE
ncbi:MAG: aldehyde dehydrogenase [Rhodothermales bacterium]|nr:aldehyde dehydrogenase [Rhodothermales bacterium]